MMVILLFTTSTKLSSPTATITKQYPNKMPQLSLFLKKLKELKRLKQLKSKNLKLRRVLLKVQMAPSHKS
jgi:hypothetical protein